MVLMLELITAIPTQAEAFEEKPVLLQAHSVQGALVQDTCRCGVMRGR